MSIADKLTQVAENVPKVYAAGQSSMVDQSKLIPKTVSGSYISVDDVSEIPHSVGCKVESVNLIDTNKLNIGVEIYISTQDDNRLSDNWYTTDKIAVLPNTTYTVSGISSRARVEYDKNGKSILWINSVAGLFTFTTSADTHYVRFNSLIEGYPTPMLNLGDTALPYTPYVNLETVSVTRTGANLLNPNNLGGGELVEFNGVPCFKYIDKGENSPESLRIEGCFKENTQYTFTVKQYREKAHSDRITVIYIKYTDGTLKAENIPTNTTYIFTTDFGKTIDCIFSGWYLGALVYLDLSVSCLNEGTTALPYEPYNAQTLTPSADGTVEGMTSVSPYMNIFSDTEGVNIEVTYNKSYGMQTEYDRFWDSYQAKGSRKGYTNCFSGPGWNNETFKPKYDMYVANAYMMFKESVISVDLPKYLAELGVTLDFANCSTFQYAFQITQFTRIGVLDGRTGGGQSFHDTFGYSYYLRTIDKIISGEDTKFSNNCFVSCNSLANITFEGVIPTSINFQWCPLTKASITNIIEHLSTTATGQTLTLKLSAVKTAFETSTGAYDGSTSAEFAALVATKTNWTITMI